MCNKLFMMIKLSKLHWWRIWLWRANLVKRPWKFVLIKLWWKIVNFSRQFSRKFKGSQKIWWMQRGDSLDAKLKFLTVARRSWKFFQITENYCTSCQKFSTSCLIFLPNCLNFPTNWQKFPTNCRRFIKFLKFPKNCQKTLSNCQKILSHC